MKFATKAIRAGVEPDPTTGAIMTPIYQTSTYVQAGPGDHKGYEYSRTQNPTRTALESNLAALENADHGLVFASGMAAIDTILKLLQPGDEVVSTNDLYGGSYRIFTKVFAAYGIKFTFVDFSDLANVEKSMGPKTRMVWVETPTNPLLSIVDLKKVAALTKKSGALLIVDNTFATPFLQEPLSLGADIVTHSATKYLAGHSDVVLGCIMLNDKGLWEKLAFLQNSCGAIPGPQDSFLTLRGIKTLHLRMERHSENAMKVAKYLDEHPKVDRVYYPGLETHPGHLVAREQMRDFGGMVSFTLKGDDIDVTVAALKKFKIFSLAESLGGVESLVGHPATMTHASIPKPEREKAGLQDTLIRLSVGIEDIDDLIADLKQAIG